MSSRSQRKRKAQARRKYERTIAEADEAFHNQDWRLFADKMLDATIAAPSKHDQRRWRCFNAYTSTISDPQHSLELTERDRKEIKRISINEAEPILFRVFAMRERATMLTNDIVRREDAAIFFRRTLKLIGTVPSSERNRQHLLYANADHVVSTGALLDQVALEVKQNLNNYPKFVYSSTLQSLPKVNGWPDPSIAQRLGVGGNNCDGCAKPQSYNAEDELFMRCSCCKKVYYCSRSCQEKDWDAGHKDACREPGQIEPGDYMILVGLESKPELNSRLVRVVGPANNPGRWAVSLQGCRNTLSIATEKLIHIRPESSSPAQVVHMRPAPS